MLNTQVIANYISVGTLEMPENRCMLFKSIRPDHFEYTLKLHLNNHQL